MEQAIPTDLLAKLRCPKCFRPVEPEGFFLACTNPDCMLRYPVIDGIPVMLIEEAEMPEPREAKVSSP